ncbi:S8 family serine peptidase [Amphritea sp.]|uniref:S8 family serine peptidase n=1 Tax=Amphritea sp. TaxID=1872502 RepID=UPI003D13E411
MKTIWPLFSPLCFSTALLFSVISSAAVVSEELQLQLDASGSFDPVMVILQFNDQNRSQQTLRQVRKAIRQLLKTNNQLSKTERKQLRRLLRSDIIHSLREQLISSRKELDPLLDFSAQGEIKDLWLINSVALTLPAYMVETLSQLPQVSSLRADLLTAAPGQAYTPPSTPEWNIDSINVPPLWSQGITGDGIVVAVIDSGVDGEHPDLAGKFRGGSHDWLDMHSSSTTPIDGFGHGTNVTGLILGGDSSGNALGMAPNAQWIAARVFDRTGYGSLSDLHAGLQWALDPDGDPSTDDAPDIVNNSWGLYGTLGTCNTEFQADIQALKDSDIAVTFAAGNSGPYSNSSLSPANQPGVMSVGALQQNPDGSLSVARSSSRGPSPCDVNAVFPTVSAPGIDVQTTGMSYGSGQPYTEWVGGSSFAVAHVSGVMALLKSAMPTATVDQLEQAIIETATDIDLSGADENTGHGLINAQSAYLNLLNILAQPNRAPVSRNDQYYFNPVLKTVIKATEGVLTNDTDADLDKLSAHLVTPPQHGSLTMNRGGRLIYVHTDTAQTDTFTYVSFDGKAFSNEVTVTLNLDTAPVANTDYVRLRRNRTKIIDVVANDTDAENNIDPTSVKIIHQPSMGGAVSVNLNGTVSYTPVEGFTGREVFTYKVFDSLKMRSNTARVVITVL